MNHADYRSFHLQRFAHGPATEADRNRSVKDCSYGGRRTSYRLTEYWEFWLRAKREAEERNTKRS
jgi:hypothetical protein